MSTSNSRRFRSFRRLLPALILLAGLSGSRAQDEGSPAHDPKLRHLQDRMVAGFTKGDADGLVGLFSSRMKTYLASRTIGAEDGYYGADQMRLLLRRMFRGRSTVRFQLLDPAARPRPDGLAVVSAVWTYKVEGSPAAEARLSFTLAPEADAWRVRELRDLK